MKTRLIAVAVMFLVVAVAFAQKSDSINTTPALTNTFVQYMTPMSSGDRLHCTNQGDDAYCCPSSTPWFCQYNDSQGTQRNCAAVSTDEDLAYLRDKCPILIKCSGSCPF